MYSIQRQATILEHGAVVDHTPASPGTIGLKSKLRPHLGVGRILRVGNGWTVVRYGQ